MIISPLYYIAVQILQVFVPLLNTISVYVTDSTQNLSSLMEILGDRKPTYLVSLTSFYNDVYSYHKYIMNTKTVYINIVFIFNLFSLLKRNYMKKCFQKL